MDQNEINLIFNGLPARYLGDNKIRIIVICPSGNGVHVWDADEFFHYTSQSLTEELVEHSYVEIDSTTNPKKIEIKLIPAILYE